MLFWQHLGLNQSWNGVGPKRSQTLLTQQILFFTKFLKHMVTNFPCMLMQCLTCWFPVEHVTCFSSVMGSLPNDPWLLRGKRFQMMAVGEKNMRVSFLLYPTTPIPLTSFSPGHMPGSGKALKALVGDIGEGVHASMIPAFIGNAGWEHPEKWFQLSVNTHGCGRFSQHHGERIEQRNMHVCPSK